MNAAIDEKNRAKVGGGGAAARKGAVNSDRWGLFTTDAFKHLPVILIALTVTETRQFRHDFLSTSPRKRLESEALNI